MDLREYWTHGQGAQPMSMAIDGIHEALAAVSERKPNARLMLPIEFVAKRWLMRNSLRKMRRVLHCFPTVTYSMIRDPFLPSDEEGDRFFRLTHMKYRFCLSGTASEIQRFLHALERQYGR